MIKITSDSTADLDYLFKEHNIPFIPLFVTLDGVDYRDGIDITPQMIFDTFNEKKVLPKTAAVGVEEFIKFFKEHTEGGHEVIHFSISSELSATYNNARLAAEEVGNVYVVDSRVLSSGTGLLILKAIDMIKEGKTAKEIFDRMTLIAPFGQTSFIVENLLFLHKGGRCSSLAKIVAGILKIRPVLELKNGKIEVGHKFMGSYIKSVPKYVETMLRVFNTPDYTRVFITHSGASEEVIEETRRCLNELAPQFKEILVTHAGATITSHCGKGTIGILYINKPDNE